MQLLRSWIVAAWCLLAAAAPACRAESGSAASPATVSSAAAVAPEEIAPAAPGAPAKVKVIPVRDAISKPVLYVIRRGLKEAQEQGMKAVILDMETPGGELGVTLDIMEALDRFEGQTLVYVNKEAISAGAIISAVADRVYFAPGGIIGAAEVVMGTGSDVPEAMKRKVNSVLNAKVRAFNETGSLRAQVIKAMMDSEYEFKVGDTVIKPKGELLSLTADEAAKTYGEPALPLLSSGTHASLEDLLATQYGKDGYVLARMEVSWSEQLASWLTSITPLLMGAGLLCVFIEFKTPGFGVFGIVGGALLALVFFGHYAAGLSGHEPALVFMLGVALVAVELFLLPGTLVAGLAGAALMLGALVWSMADVWPGEMPELNSELLLVPFLNLAAAIGVAIAGAFALAKFLPRGWFWDKMVLQAAVASDAPAVAPAANGVESLAGERGRTVSALRPMGEVEIAGRRHEARASVGSLERDEPVRVTGLSGRVLIVERDAS